MTDNIRKAKELTVKQKKFANLYITLGNATEAAKQAGYSKKTAYSIGEENLRKPEIKEYIKNRMQELEEESVAEQRELLQALTTVIRDDRSKTSDKLKAIELMMKKYNMFNAEEDTDKDIVINIGFTDED